MNEKTSQHCKNFLLFLCIGWYKDDYDDDDDHYNYRFGPPF